MELKEDLKIIGEVAQATRPGWLDRRIHNPEVGGSIHMELKEDLKIIGEVAQMVRASDS